MANQITFDGAARTVTGSKHLLSLGGKQVLVDCGMFQGSRELRDRNYKPFPFDPRSLDAVVLTHAHMDHIGLLPKLVREGYDGPIYCTKATKELCAISLPDSGRLQEEDAYHANKHGSRHEIALPLYTEKDAFASLKNLKAVGYETPQSLPGGAVLEYFHAGHILGSAFAQITLADGKKVLMSGDLGRYDTPIIDDPTVMPYADYLVVESTYGDRLHPKEDTVGKLESLIKDAIANQGVILVPSFAIGRTQELLYYIATLQREQRIGRIPIYVDSPMATSTSALYRKSHEEWDPEMRESVALNESLLEPEGLSYVRDKNASKAINQQSGPMIIIAGSGMMNGGRIIHHVMKRISDPRTTILFTGYQAGETPGRRLIEGADTIKFYGQEFEVRAKIDRLNALSAHADQGEIMRWLGGFEEPPKCTYIVHGEPPAQEVLATKIRQDLGWNVVIPDQGQSFGLDG